LRRWCINSFRVSHRLDRQLGHAHKIIRSSHPLGGQLGSLGSLGTSFPKSSHCLDPAKDLFDSLSKARLATAISKSLRRHRGSPKLAIHPVKHPRQSYKLLISHLLNPSQRMITGNSCLDRTGSLTAPAPFGFHSTSSNDFRFCILRPGLGQVSDFRLSERKFKNRLASCCASEFSPNLNRQSKI
jgi:hypothetical protein